MRYYADLCLDRLTKTQIIALDYDVYTSSVEPVSSCVYLFALLPLGKALISLYNTSQF